MEQITTKMSKSNSLLVRLGTFFQRSELRGKNSRQSFASQIETDATMHTMAFSWQQSERDRLPYDRQTMLEQSLEAWRVNPLARRIVSLTTQYVVGNGIAIHCRDTQEAQVMQAFWNHPLNRMDVRIFELCDELTRTGNLFLLLTTDEGGNSYIRAYPTTSIESITAHVNDLEQPLVFTLKATAENMNPTPIAAFDVLNDDPSQPVMLHYSINRPVGAQWGESDLAPLLRWLSRYANWLEDRARLNRFRNAFLYVIKSRFASEADRYARQQHLNANPPTPGAILVTDQSEEWSVLNPQLESQDAGEDGLALKKMIASGAGVPLHFLAEPESATRTTAEAAGGPTYRFYEQRQRYFLWLLEDILRVVLFRKAFFTSSLDPQVSFHLQGADISVRDNVSLSQAAANVLPLLVELRNRQLIDDAEMVRLAYRFAGEQVTQ
jgi:hypothetical protein